MKILVASDIHGSKSAIIRIKELFEEEKPDKLIILGDLFYQSSFFRDNKDYAPREVANILNDMKDNLIVVRGNCDEYDDEMMCDFKFNENDMIEIEGKKIFLTHGHKYNMDNLPREEFDILMYGHLHTGFIQKKEGKIFVNPGSIARPKEGAEHSYIIIDGNTITLKNLNGNVIDKIEI